MRGKSVGVMLLVACLLMGSVSMGGATTEARSIQSSASLDKQKNKSARNHVMGKQASRLVAPTRVSKQTFPFCVALQNEQTVLLWDASKQGSQPIPVATDGKVQIIDWSVNGEWIAYLRSPVPESYLGPWYLWVSKADESKNYQVDSREITGTPKWSPTENMLVYRTKETSKEQGLVVRITSKGIDRIQTIFQETDLNEVSDYSWYPDGKSFAVRTNG